MQPPRTPSSATPKIVLTIAGSDSSGGAGIAADLKTGAAFGVFVCTAITAVTAQNAAGVSDFVIIEPSLLRAQIDAVVSAHPPQAIKLGMLGNRASIEVVAEFLQSQTVPVVIDPVLGASSGASLWRGDDAALAYREHLLPRATLLTPNLPEAARLLDEPIAEDYATMEQQAARLCALGAPAVLLKGGHLAGPHAADCLANTDGFTPFTSARVDTPHTHGTGCTLASAIAAGLAQGLALKPAIAAAKTYLDGALKHSRHLNLVPTNGPLHHFYAYW